MSKRLVKITFTPTYGTEITNCGVYATKEAALASCERREGKTPINVQEALPDHVGVFFYNPESQWLGGHFYLILRPDDNAYANVTNAKAEAFGVVSTDEYGNEEWVAGSLQTWEEAVKVCNQLTDTFPNRAFLPARF